MASLLNTLGLAICAESEVVGGRGESVLENNGGSWIKKRTNYRPLG